MKNIPIKFRGNSAVDAPNFINKGDFVFGSSIIQRHDKFWLGDDKGSYVDPDSVCQLVGYDINGAEVYEGDRIIDSNGDEGYASMLGIYKHTGEWDLCEYLMKPAFIDFAKLRKVDSDE